MSEHRPDISVVIPVHNAEAWIDDAIESALGQQREGLSLEIVVSDDGSTDGSLERAARHPHVRVLEHVNTGPAGARNRGAAVARGAHLAFLDADDRWVPGSLEARLRLLQAQGADIVYGRVRLFVEPGATSRGAADPAELRGLLFGSMLLTCDIWQRVGPLDETLRFGELMDWQDRVEAAGGKTVHLEEVVFERRLHAKNSSRDAAIVRSHYARSLRGIMARRRSRREHAGGG